MLALLRATRLAITIQSCTGPMTARRKRVSKKYPTKFVAHSATVLSIAVAQGWLPGARYTNLRDVRRFGRLGFLDIEWKRYDFQRHLEAAAHTRPMLTVARDIE